MGTPEFTPGPWRAKPNGGDDEDPRSLYICAKGGFDNAWHMIAQTDAALPARLDGDPEANAHLIAAAPDLHRALTLLLEVADAPGAPEFNWERAKEGARAAVTKAEGRQP